jgi:hypothetical protein
MAGSLWDAGVFAAKAGELSRRLRHWHAKTFHGSTPLATSEEARRWVRQTFREILGDVTADHGPRTVGWHRVIFDWAEPDGQECVSETCQSPEPDTDRVLTVGQMGDFLRHLDAAPPLPALDDLRDSFRHILDLPAWTVREPEDVWERSVASYGHDEQGELRWYVVTGRPVPTERLDALTDAAAKLLAAAPADWGAIAQWVPVCGEPRTAAESGEAGSAPTPADDRELSETVAWLKRVTPEWPPMGIDWPLVLSKAERLFTEHPDTDLSGAGQPRDGQPIADFLREGFDAPTIQDADPYSRGFVYACQLLDAFTMLEAFCKASLAIGYDLDAIERPVRQLSPFHALMVLGWTVAEWIRCFRDLSQADIEAVTESAAQPVKAGAAFGHNAHQATWNLADEICQLSDSVAEGQLAVSRLAEQPEGTIEYAWVKLSGALEGRFPRAIETKHVRVLLEGEFRAAFAAAFPEGKSQETPQTVGRPSPLKVKAKRSTERGEGRAKLIAALIVHHKYADGSCLNLEFIANNDLARKAGVSVSTASAFFAKEFHGHDKYRALCGDKTRLVAALKLLNGDFAPHHLYGRSPSGEGEDPDE